MDSEDTLLGTFRQELSLAEKDHADASKQNADWAKKVQNYAQSVAALKHLIAMRQMKLQAEEEAAADAQEQIDGPDVTGTKASFVLQMIQSNPAGVTPAEIREAGKGVGFDGSSNFPYTTLSKLKIAKKIKEDLGKYFPVA